MAGAKPLTVKHSEVQSQTADTHSTVGRTGTNAYGEKVRPYPKLQIAKAISMKQEAPASLGGGYFHYLRCLTKISLDYQSNKIIQD